MPGDVALQTDVGALSVQSLGAVTSILTAVSADSLAPLALMEMESLGALFHTSGRFADSIRSKLQRCPIVRLDRLALLLGWRKGDASSLMANSTRGQAVALLSLCLMTSLGGKKSDVGLVLSQLRSEFLPRHVAVSGVSELADVASVLAGKSSSLGYGNFLVEQTTRIVESYHGLENILPRDLMDGMAAESTAELLIKVARVFQDEKRICRIRGSASMASIVTMIQAMFPLNTTIIVEGMVTQSAEHLKICCEIISMRGDSTTEIFLEKSASHFDKSLWTKTLSVMGPQPSQSNSFAHFRWSGWLANQLRLIFLNHGATCDQQVVQAFCDLVILIPAALNVLPTVSSTVAQRDDLKPTSLLSFLGPMPRARMATVCNDILECTPTGARITLKSALVKFAAAVSNSAPQVLCACISKEKCHWCDWTFVSSNIEEAQYHRCPKYVLWQSLTATFARGVWSFFINAGQNVTICNMNMDTVPSYIIAALTDRAKPRPFPVSTLMSGIMTLALGRDIQEDEVIASSTCSTVYPSILQAMALPSYQSVTFELIDGRIMYENRYYPSIVTELQSKVRPKARKPLPQCDMKPSHTGRADVDSGYNHFYIREGAINLVAIYTFTFGGYMTTLNLKKVLLGYLGMRWSEPCPHRVTGDMDLNKYKAISTSVAAPSAFGKLGVAMTRASAVSQLLCCEDGYQAVLQTRCCLNCAAEPYADKNAVVIIVT